MDIRVSMLKCSDQDRLIIFSDTDVYLDEHYNVDVTISGRCSDLEFYIEQVNSLKPDSWSCVNIVGLGLGLEELDKLKLIRALTESVANK